MYRCRLVYNDHRKAQIYINLVYGILTPILYKVFSLFYIVIYFRYPMFKARTQLAVIDYQAHKDRGVKHNEDGSVQ